MLKLRPPTVTLHPPVQTVTDKNDKVTINFAWHELPTFFDLISQTQWGGRGMSSGIATPGHTRVTAHVKFTGAQVKIM